MKFSRSRVLSTLLVCALAVAGSGVAQAQECIVRAASSNMVRAEGLTEVVGDINLRCRPPEAGTGFGFEADAVPETFTVTVALNSNITNTINDDREVAVADTTAMDYNAHLNGGIVLSAVQLNNNNVPSMNDEIDSAAFGAGELSDDGTEIEWTVTAHSTEKDTPAANLGMNQDGFSLTITGIRANAAAVGDGEDITANVLVGGTAVNEAPMKVADVTTGLAVEVDAAKGVQCNDGEMTATITIEEGFASAIKANDSFEVTFTGIPEGVKVTVPGEVMVSADAAGADFALKRTTGRVSGADDDNVLELSVAGAGQVIYNVVQTPGDSTADPVVEPADTTDDSKNEESAQLAITFEWDGGDAGLGSAMVYVSYNPTSSEGGDTYMVGGAAMPRFGESPGNTVLEIDDCMTELFYPFVTSNSGYDTGIVISNTSSATGSCMATYSNSEESMDIGEVMPGMQAIFLVSSHMEDFSGYLTVNCTTQAASGFAHVVDSSGLAGSQGYIAQCTGEGCK